MKLVLPYPPTANLYWRVFRGRAVKSADARRYQALVRALSIQQRGVQAIHSGPVSVVAKLYRPRRIGDLDNSLKVALDALKGVAYLDDSQVVRIEAERHDDKANPRLEIEVNEALLGPAPRNLPDESVADRLKRLAKPATYGGKR